MDISVIGKYTDRLEKVKNFLRKYQACPDREGKVHTLYLLDKFLDDCPLYICDLLILESVQQLGFSTNQAIMIVSDRYKLIIKLLMEELKSNG
jgi:hypothetical protein